MKNKLMIYRVFILCFTIGILFTSCSSDDDSENENPNNNLPNSVKLPENLLGTYRGLLNTPELENVFGATGIITETEPETYTIDFSNDVASLIDIKFSPVTPESIFVYQDIDREIVVTVSSQDEGDLLTVSIGDVSNPTISFAGSK
ncbi:hypothetical protein [uncultured Algibacter sp.]|uniref:hypothetical protein n=1 Tax=uncultured Algibacter sp. TaxID=298659 RepID=UPI003216AEBA